MSRSGGESDPEPSGHSSRAHALTPAGLAALIALLGLMISLPGLGLRSFWFPDEPDVAEPALTMMRSGDWVVPRQNDRPWLDYPPLVYWAGAGTATLTGARPEFAFRLPVALVAALTAGLTAFAARRLFGARAGLWAGLTLLTAAQFLVQSNNFHPDMFFAFGQAAGIAAYARGALAAGRPGSTGWRVLGFACFGLAILAKSPLGLFLPGLVLTLWHLTRRPLRPMFMMAPLALVSLAVALPWYLAVIRALGFDEWWREFYLQNFDRFSNGARGHEAPWHYYLTHLWGDWAPWSLLLPTAIAGALRSWRRDPVMRLLLIWFGAYLLFLSLATTKRSVYLLPTYPALALMVGRHLAALFASARAAALRAPLIVLGGAVALLGAALPFAQALIGGSLHRNPDTEFAGPTLAALRLPLTLLGLALLAGGSACVALALRRAWERSLLAFASCFLLGFAWIHLTVLPRVDDVRSYGPATRWMREVCGAEPFGYFLPGAEIKRAGFRVEDPLFLPLRTFTEPAEALAWLERGDHLLVCSADRYDTLVAGAPGLAAIPHRRLMATSRRFEVLGRAAAEPGG